MTAAERRQDKADAIDQLREWIKPGDTIWTVLRGRSDSGMTRWIDLYIFHQDIRRPGTPDKLWLSWNAAKAGVGSWNDKRECIQANGAGMDMGFHLVYNLSCILYPDGFGCIGEGCPSNDHSNGDRDYTPHLVDGKQPHEAGYVAHWHQDGGYALRQEWI